MRKFLSRKNVIVFFIVVITILRIGMFIRIPYNTIGGSMADSHYQVLMGKYITNGWWFGDYSYLTLLKGASFPIFVAVANWLCMPYSMLLGLYFVLAAFLFSFAIHKIFRNKIASVLSYLFILYSPIGFDSVSQYLYRNVLVFPAVVIIVSFLALTLHYCRLSGKKFLLFSLLSGISIGFFYYLREDSIWIWPVVIGTIAIIIADILIVKKVPLKIKLRKVFIACTPVLVFLIITLGYKSLNAYRYGVFLTNDRTNGAFATFTGNIMKIDDPTCNDPDVWISRATLEKVIDELPSLKDYKSVFTESYSNWGGPVDDKGDMPVWAIREALNNLGYFSDAETLQESCTRFNNELLQAVDEGRLHFDDAFHFTTQSRGVYLSELPSRLLETFKNLWSVCICNGADVSLSPSTGDESQIRQIESITGVNTIHQPNDETLITGWIIFKNSAPESVDIKISDSSSTHIATVSDWAGSLQYYSEYPSEQRKSFEFRFEGSCDKENAVLDITANGNPVLSTAPEFFENDDVIVYVDYFGYNNDADPYMESSERIAGVENTILSICRVISLFLTVLLPVSLLISIIAFIRKPSWNVAKAVLFPLFIFGSMLALEFGVTLFTSWLEDSVWFYSSAGVIACLITSSLISICSTIKIISHKL